MSLSSHVSARNEAGLRFWVEVGLVSGVYVAYSMVRNLFGSAAVSPGVAAQNADYIIDIEKAMGLYIEADVQAIFIDATVFIQFWNLFYGAFHFLVTFVVLIWLYRRFPDEYRFWRRAGMIATASAVVGFAAFPLMPPRLLGNCGTYGACRPNEQFVDTVIEVGGIWSFETSGLETISNQYAAMPSLAYWVGVVVCAHPGATAAFDPGQDPRCFLSATDHVRDCRDGQPLLDRWRGWRGRCRVRLSGQFGVRTGDERHRAHARSRVDRLGLRRFRQ